MMSRFRWRPRWHTRRYIRHCQQLDRYYAKCQKLAGGHHSELPHVKKYNWLISQENRRYAQGMPPSPPWENLEEITKAWMKEA